MANKKKSPPRNAYVRAMTLRHKTQIFDHKTEEQGGDKNESRNLKDEAEQLKKDSEDEEDE